MCWCSMLCFQKKTPERQNKQRPTYPLGADTPVFPPKIECQAQKGSDSRDWMCRYQEVARGLKKKKNAKAA